MSIIKYHKIVLAGGNGYLGTVLANYYKDKATEIIILSRHEKQSELNIRTVVWDGKTWGKWAAENRTYIKKSLGSPPPN